MRKADDDEKLAKDDVNGKGKGTYKLIIIVLQ